MSDLRIQRGSSLLYRLFDVVDAIDLRRFQKKRFGVAPLDKKLGPFVCPVCVSCDAHGPPKSGAAQPEEGIAVRE